MKLNDLEDFKIKNNFKFYFNFNIKKFNWFNIGGKTRVFFRPKNLSELREFLKLYSLRGKLFILGLGSNVLFKDDFYEGVVIKLANNYSSLTK